MVLLNLSTYAFAADPSIAMKMNYLFPFRIPGVKYLANSILFKTI